MAGILAQSEFLQVLPEDLTRALEESAVSKRYRDGESVFRRGDPGDGFYGVVSGRIQILGRGAEGRDFVLSYLGPGEWFGEICMYDDLPRTHDSLAKGDTELRFVPRREFRQLFDAEPRWHRALAELLGGRLRLIFGLIEDAMLLDLPARLAKRLLELAADHGQAGAGGATRIDLHLPQEELASMLGATREAIGRHLKRWQREGWIELAYGRIEIRDRAALDALRGG